MQNLDSLVLGPIRELELPHIRENSMHEVPDETSEKSNVYRTVSLQVQKLFT